MKRAHPAGHFVRGDDFFSKKKPSAERCVFVLCPSAGGISPKELITVLNEIGTVKSLEGGWSNKIFNSKTNVDKVRTCLN